MPFCQRFLHVLAGAKAAAGAGEDRDFEPVVAAEFGPGLGQLGAHLVAEGIEALRPVHPHDQDLPVALGLDDGHVFSPLLCFLKLSLRAERSNLHQDAHPVGDCHAGLAGSQ